MHLDELDYELPDGSIAQTPVEPRDAARLLVDRGPGHPPDDTTVAELDQLLQPGDLVVVNETRVLPARVSVRRSGGAEGEVLLLEPIAEADGVDADDGDAGSGGVSGGELGRHGWWEALVRPSRKMRSGDVVESTTGALAFEIGAVLGDGRRRVRPIHNGELLDALELAGVAPLPPYIHERLDDQDRYQTVFADRPASAAAPTAGLHMTPELLERLGDRGVELATVELVVGLDTFRPVTVDHVEDHVIHSEQYSVPASTWDSVQRTRDEGRRVVAVGTTTVRALESMAATGELSGRTSLFITPGFEFHVVDVLLTNFHLPKSSLLAMIQAFVGPRWRELYATAQHRGYRFLSFGDAMLLTRSASTAGTSTVGGGAS